MTPAPTTERLQSIQRMVADQLGDKLPDFEADARRDWETQNQGGVWEDIKDSVRSSWERARGRR